MDESITGDRAKRQAYIRNVLNSHVRAALGQVFARLGIAICVHAQPILVLRTQTLGYSCRHVKMTNVCLNLQEFFGSLATCHAKTDNEL
jgi:hypothetical protein